MERIGIIDMNELEDIMNQAIDGLLEMAKAYRDGDDSDRELINTINGG